MSRTLRKVSADWEHPKDDMGHYIPIYDEFYGDALKEWLDECKDWDEGTHPDIKQYGEDIKVRNPYYPMWAGGSPDPERYRMVKWEEKDLTHIQLYEDVTEGTPVSPKFKMDEFEQLCEYAADNCTTFADFKTTKEQWMKMLSGGIVSHKEGNVTFM